MAKLHPGDELMTDVLKLTGIKSKREAVELGATNHSC
jgi:Arc/MetJ family transcription regulator